MHLLQRLYKTSLLDIVNIVVSFFVVLHDDYPVVLGVLILMALDTLLAIYIALNPKYKHVRFSSMSLITGLVVKTIYYTIILGVAYGVYLILTSYGDTFGVWRFLVTFFSLGFAFTVIILTEFGSILEHLATIGVNITIFNINITQLVINKWHQAIYAFERLQPHEIGMYDDIYVGDSNASENGELEEIYDENTLIEP